MRAFVLIKDQAAYPRAAVIAGLQAIGYNTYADGLSSSFSKKDLLVTWTPWKSSLSQRAGEMHKERGGRWIVLENGYIQTQATQYAVGLNGFNGWGDHRNESSPPDRWESLGLEIKPWRESGEHVVLFAQMGGHDYSLTMPPYWPDDIVQRLSLLTRRSIIYRPKPLRPKYLTKQYKNVSMPSFVDTPLSWYFENAWAAVVYSSKTAVEALRCGIPALYDGPMSILRTIVPRGVEFIEDPPQPERWPFFCDLAYAQWSAEELSTGLPFQRLLS